MLKQTPLFEKHQQAGGKLVDFSGWNMPVNYGSQIEEHNAVRTDAGMFDVSHMTIVDVCGADAKAFLQHILANDVAKLTLQGKALYSGMLNEKGGVIDDLIVYLMDFGYRVIVNCATREKDLAWMNLQAEAFAVELNERDDMAMIAVQGPKARGLVDDAVSAGAELAELSVFQGKNISYGGNALFVARTGYTGEDGYEMVVPNDLVETLWQSLVNAGVRPCGLGARDTLRLEAGMNLYGHEMDDDTSPLVANMGWTIAWEPNDRMFIGREAIETEKAAGITHKLVGVVMKARGVLREGLPIYCGDEEVGVTTSGTFSPSLGHAIAVARIQADVQGECEVGIRNKRVPIAITKPVFVRNGESLI